MRREKTLLVLDGLEPLQDPYQGLKDPSVQRLVEELARDNAGLCLITTRERVRELEDFPEETLQRDLEQISPEAGRALLRVKGVRGTDAELEAASEAFGNHALAINLLANYLRGIEGHHVGHAAEIPDLDMPEQAGRHPRRVMAAFAKRFGKGPEVEVLRLLGLFDRPATKGAIEALRAPPPIAHVTEQICQEEGRGFTRWWHRLTGDDDVPSGDLLWDRVLESLRDAGLVAPAGHHGEAEVDAHPLVREHFGAELREGYTDAWREGHGRLYEYFKGLPDKEQPDTLEEMAPLFQAVFHGCQAGRHKSAYDKVYRPRIRRENEAYQIHKLGAFGADLAAVHSFLLHPWREPAGSLSGEDKAWLLNAAGFRLRALGRLREAIDPMQVGLVLQIKQEVWESAAIIATNLSELHLTLGEVAKAVARAEESVAHADQSGDLTVAAKELNQAVDGLRQAGAIHHVPRGLLARAALSRMTGEVDRARRDLDEVLRIAKRSEMRLRECDAHLEAARLHLAQTDSTATARTELDQAKKLIEETGYHRRDRDVEEIEEKLGGRA